MKNIIVIALAALSVLSCHSKEKKNDWQEYDLQGKVKSIHCKFYSATEKFGEVVKGEPLETIMGLSVKFNDKGNKIEENLYESDGDFFLKYV